MDKYDEFKEFLNDRTKECEKCFFNVDELIREFEQKSKRQRNLDKLDTTIDEINRLKDHVGDIIVHKEEIIDGSSGKGWLYGSIGVVGCRYRICFYGAK